MTDGPLVSVCIPVYNGEKFLRETIESVINQTYRNLEIIFCDNCSTDDTIKIIGSYRDSRIRLVRNDSNLGNFNNFRKVLSLGTGKYLTYLSADDLIVADAVEASVVIMENDPSIYLVNSYVDIIDEHGRRLHTKKYFFGAGKLSRYWAIRSNFIYGSNLLGEPNGSLFLRSAYNAIPEPKFRHSNSWTYDIDLKFELILQGETYMVPRPLSRFRVSSVSTSVAVLRFKQSKLFTQFVYNLHRDPRYRLSFVWVIVAAVNSFMLQIARNVFYVLFVKKQ
jgi:glycosyltransferase involved in cell wall biosynthesis